jgi:hypothetical protein
MIVKLAVSWAELPTDFSTTLPAGGTTIENNMSRHTGVFRLYVQPVQK